MKGNYKMFPKGGFPLKLTLMPNNFWQNSPPIKVIKWLFSCETHKLPFGALPFAIETTCILTVIKSIGQRITNTHYDESKAFHWQ